MLSRGTRWCFTLNNPTEDEALHLSGLGVELSDVSYIVCGAEVSESGTPHLQGYLELPSRLRGAAVKLLVGERCHLELSRGTSTQASSYCKKDADFFEFGELLPGPGFRTDLESIKSLMDEGARGSCISQTHFSRWVQYRRSFDAYIQLASLPRDFATTVSLYWGPTGTGKTRAVHELESSLWTASDCSLSWFDGYDDHEAVLFDDFVSIKNDKFGFLLQLLDRYPLRVPIKGGFVNWRPERIYFTSNLPLADWFTGVSEDSKAALKRRITNTIHFT